ncbi:MAG: hypothetical protein N4A35_00035 [Flavobacteriales bacterium]|jgi:hypothetical protein|nr:hypothetical protein [Flavobacteriales bacterium]
MKKLTLISIIVSTFISIDYFSQQIIFSELQLEKGVIGVDIIDPIIDTENAHGESRIVVDGALISGVSIHKVHYKIGSTAGAGDVKTGFVTVGDLISENNSGFVYTGEEMKMVLMPNLQSDHLYLEIYSEDYNGNYSSVSTAQYHQ